MRIEEIYSKYNLTPSASESIDMAIKLAKQLGHKKLDIPHLTLSSCAPSHISINKAFLDLGIDKAELIMSLQKAAKSYVERKRKKEVVAENIELSFEYASQLAKIHNNGSWLGVEHIFSGCLKLICTSRQNNQSLIKFRKLINPKSKKEMLAVLKHIKAECSRDLIPPQNDFDPNDLMNEIALSAEFQRQPHQNKKDASMLEVESLYTDLNEIAEKKKECEIFGREAEINRVFEVLLRKNKSNVILVGEAGVGKTAIVDGLAEKIARGQCPTLLSGKRILSLDLNSLVAGTIYRGQFEERMKNALNLLKENREYILFIDEIHNIVGAGGSEGSLDVSNILKPLLSSGEISCIGATTDEEYKKFFKNRSALNRRFEMIEVNELSKADTLNLLRSAKASYQSFHNVEYSESVLGLVVDMCEEHLPKKKFPDKAIDILDEAGAKTRKLVTKTKQSCKKNVDKDTIYEIFSSILKCEPNQLKEGNYRLSNGRIGFY
jgi:ATP-dependent Clp protease ATP-binding subunit ClpA